MFPSLPAQRCVPRCSAMLPRVSTRASGVVRSRLIQERNISYAPAAAAAATATAVTRACRPTLLSNKQARYRAPAVTFRPIQQLARASTMKAVVYNGPNAELAVEERPMPEVQAAGDAIVRLKYTTICGTDLHIMQGHVPSCAPGRVLGHEGVGVVHRAGAAVGKFKEGDVVLIPAVTSCGTCHYCRRGMSSQCEAGGWALGNTIDGTQAEFVRVPCADTSLHRVPDGVDPRTAVMLSDILPTGFECGVLNAKVEPGCSLLIIGAGPVGLAALLTAQLYAPGTVVVVDFDENRLQLARELGATAAVKPAQAEETVMRLTEGRGCDAVLEVVGLPQTFHQCQELVGPGGTIANVGVHGTSVELHLEKLWNKNIAITTRLVDTVTVPMLLKLVASKKLPAERLITHRFAFSDMMKAYDTFKAASANQALKVIIEF